MAGTLTEEAGLPRVTEGWEAADADAKQRSRREVDRARRGKKLSRGRLHKRKVALLTNFLLINNLNPFYS